MAKQDNSKILLYGGGLLIVYFGILRPLLEKLGLARSQAEQQVINQQNLPNNKNPFSSTYWKTIPNAKLITRNATNALAKRIFDAMGYFSDDESAVFSVFTQLKTKTQVSWLADIFQQNYKMDLLDFLKRGKGQLPQAGLSDTELQQVLNIVNSLPIK
jgi:hypothetical protein